MHLLHRLVNEDPHHACFNYLTNGLKENDCEDLEHHEAELVRLLLVHPVFCPHTDQVLGSVLEAQCSDLNHTVERESRPMAIV